MLFVIQIEIDDRPSLTICEYAMSIKFVYLTKLALITLGHYILFYSSLWVLKHLCPQ